MQQTTNYKLNLIETSDPFSPGSLNENAEKTETELAALDSRVTMLEARRIAVGTYIGNGGIITVPLDFTPFVVLIQHGAMRYSAMAVTDASFGQILTIVPSGFQVSNDSYYLNDGGRSYRYLAIG